MEPTKLIEHKAKNWPGIVLVVSALTFIVTAKQNQGGEGLAFWQTASIAAVAFLFYKMGTVLDGFVFDPLYSLPPSLPKKSSPAALAKYAWWHVGGVLFRPLKWIVDKLPKTTKLTSKRDEATKKLLEAITGTRRELRDTDRQGIYESAKTLFHGSDEWDDHVKPWLDLSKASRSFVWPLVALLIYDVNRHRFRVSWLEEILSKGPLNWLTWWKASLAVLLLLLVLLLYLWLRVLHMLAMYELVESSDYVPLPNGVGAGERRTAVRGTHLVLGETSTPKQKRTVMFFLVAKSSG